MIQELNPNSIGELSQNQMACGERPRGHIVSQILQSNCGDFSPIALHRHVISV